MTMPRIRLIPLLLGAALTMTGLVGLSGCAELGLGGGSDQEMASAPLGGPAESQPYYANEFSDLLIPNELSWDREKSMLIRTDSFAGGVLHYSGRVEITSVSDFFINTMPKNGWKLVGSAKYRKVLLAFVKPNKTCTVQVSENEFGLKTDVAVYITEDLTATGSGQTAPSSSPFIPGL
ncbi:hypothetical protein ACUUL3_06875 [Thiovibrio sp. JS02]